MGRRIISREMAIRKGLPRYFTGLPCRNGHVAERTLKKWECVTCKAEHDERYRQRHNAAIKKNQAKYRDKNRKRLRKWFKNHYRTNRTIIRERQRLYSIRTSAKNVARAAKWKRANPESVKACTRNRRARIKGNGGKHTARDIQALLKLQRYRCKACRADVRISGHHVDHKTPICRGGSNGPRNLQILCPKCNFDKRDMTMREFMSYRARLAQ